MKNLLYTCLLTCFSLQVASAQFGVFSLDSLMKYHPQGKVIHQQFQKYAQIADDSLRKRIIIFQRKLYKVSHINLTPKEMVIVNKGLQEEQKQIQNYQDSLINVLNTFQTTKLDSLHSAILLDCRWYVQYHRLSFIIFSKDVLYYSNLVTDYTEELLAFMEEKYRYTLANGRIQRKVSAY